MTGPVLIPGHGFLLQDNVLMALCFSCIIWSSPKSPVILPLPSHPCVCPDFVQYMSQVPFILEREIRFDLRLVHKVIREVQSEKALLAF